MNTTKCRFLVTAMLTALCLTVSGCAASKSQGIGLEDGVYTADFNTDSTMFHVNEALNGKGILTVENNSAVIHIVLTSENIINLYPGSAKDAEKNTDKLYQPTAEEVTYADGYKEEVNAFDVEVPYLDKEFDLALIGKKGKWYDHKVSVSNPVPYEASADEALSDKKEAPAQGTDETMLADVALEGGSGKSSIESPAKIMYEQDGTIMAEIKWSSPYYDYMIVNDVKYLPVNTEGNSVFEIPVEKMGEPVFVIADTIAMSTPHEVEYTLTFTAR